MAITRLARNPMATSEVAAGETVRVRGLVQGVGFRPTVWRLATECGLDGEVWNDGDGVVIRIWGESGVRQRLLDRLIHEPPPLARIDALVRETIGEPPPAPGFHIVASRGGGVRTGVVPDAATCAACLAEIRDPADRRHGYAFTNCTHCGPRLTIVQAIPYDRANTSMAAFAMCPRCRSEYDDPGDRRFHAQPNACPDCGPRLWLETAGGTAVAATDTMAAVRGLLADGAIVAVKGLGGFHLAVDARDETAVARLRARKRRHHKPFALMARDVAVIRRYCTVSETEVELLASAAAPVVILEADGPGTLAAAVAPGHRTLGFMFPYAPLHHLLLAGLDHPLVLTSANQSEEPQCTDNDEARSRLAAVADYCLMHDRPIASRVDDSVARVMAGVAHLLRRARGYAPAPIALPAGFEAAPPVLAMGGELKNAFCLVRDGAAIVSQHMGDLANAATYADYRRNLARYAELFDHRPAFVAVDRHPDYLAGKLGSDYAAREGLPVTTVQHHHAHLAACMADNGVPIGAGPVLGVALDGLGYGDDGTVWGGEWLLADYRGYVRLARFAHVPLIGGEQAVREPWRLAYAHIVAALGWPAFQRDYKRLPLCAALRERPLATLDAMIARGLNCPVTSSCGRLFDAVAAAVGLCRDSAGYEGQAAIELEASIDAETWADTDDGYPFAVSDVDGLTVLDAAPLWSVLLDDLARGTSPAVIAARFHRGLAAAVVSLTLELRRCPELPDRAPVALSGGVFQNRRLFEAVVDELDAQGLRVLFHRQVPANDGGLSLGQAAVAGARALMPTADGVSSCV
ncbi:carbamoyltransferase HypF [Arhodomonas sp. AD133]|uniref:carbamoyltransferase HypF n=1 Tax=Arhodomonas sp. AD133 TaxID=3415009 RepID=UPI003EB914A7